MKICLTLIILTCIVTMTTSDTGNVRLVNGYSRCSGRVEVFHRGQWGTVCHYNWDLTDAAVVCREMDCGEALRAVGYAYFGPGSGLIWMGNVSCSGPESTLKTCVSRGWGVHSCDHRFDAGVICSDIGSVRLVDGNSSCSGRVEVLHDGQWGTVCSYNWDTTDAAVVCKQLDCGEALQAPRDAHFGPGSGPISMGNVSCTGSESTLKSCESNGWDALKCFHIHDAGVICSVSQTERRPAQSTSITPPQTPAAASLSIPPVVVIVLGSVLLLLLLPLIILIQQNRAMRRAVSNMRRRTWTEADYEKIDHRRTTEAFYKEIDHRDDLISQRGA
ncbi:deleted in malignant brain tumors 1 protein-like isoform X2 [Myxocyprinus asiaticus]|uniref:deleted in malignant brain tumors 1 protein-like isoform X2 n=1 Tax=Myxocyprinus asiaticus TaxID=70543 RepID=UPI002222FC0C|nr:deleted in malignant brain tumors 1 protein-like isoform X2 [Myxocyprinus asiaticus]